MADDSTSSRRGEGRLLRLPKCGILAAIVVALVAVVIWTRPIPIDPVPFDLAPNPALEGALQPNTILAKGRRTFVGEGLVGPESFAINSKGEIYTGLIDGRIVKLNNNEVVNVTRFREGMTLQCNDPEHVSKCGRPLRVDFVGDKLFVVDAFNGLYSVDVTTGDQALIWDIKTDIPGAEEAKLLNNFAVLDNGSILMTDSSYKFILSNHIYDLLEARPSGKLFMYTPSTGETHLLINNISFANGLLLSENEDFVLIAECGRARIVRYYLKGPKKGSLDVFANLPGLPDNLRTSSRGTIWVPLPGVRHGIFLEMLFSSVLFRKLILKLGIDVISVLSATSPYGLIVELDWSGNIVHSYHDPKGEVARYPTEVVEVGGKLLIGSYVAPWIVELDTEYLF